MRGTFQKILGLAIILCLILFVGCERNNHTPLVPLTPLGPDSGETGITYNFSTSTYDPDEDSISYQFDWGNSDTSNWSNFVASGSSITMAKSWADTGNYSVRARAKDNKDAISAWSDGQTINIVLFIPVTPNRAPDIPAKPDGPGIGLVDTMYSFTTSTIDSDNNFVSYQFDWGNSDTSNWSDFVASGKSVTMSKSWSETGIYLIKARAKDMFGATSDWSAPCSIAVLIKWRYKTEGDIYSSPAISDDGIIYFTSDDYYLYALNPDGSLKWRYYVGDHDEFSSPVIGPDGAIYIGTYTSLLYAINPDGTFKWQYGTGSGVLPSPAVGPDSTIYFSSYDGFLYALNSDGSLKWRSEVGDVFRSAVSIGQDRTIYFNDATHLYALNPDSTLKWQYPADSVQKSIINPNNDFLPSSPSIDADGTIYCSLSDDYFYAINSDGTLKWRYQLGNLSRSSPTIGFNGTIYFGSNDKNLYALNSDGSLKWQYRARSYIYSSPAVISDGTICFGGRDDYLYILNSDGTLKWRGDFARDVVSSPTIGSDGTIYFGSGDEFFYAVYGTGQLANTPWPKYRHDLRNTGSVSGK
jgi:outer membrane protein assembly factor BamB